MEDPAESRPIAGAGGESWPSCLADNPPFARPRVTTAVGSLETPEHELGADAIDPGAIAMPATSRRVRHALIGGAIGAVAGLAVCTAISNIADDAAVDRFTTCTAKGYLLTGSIGFATGFLVGWLASS